VRSDLKHRGLGRALLQRLLRHAVDEGMTEVLGSVLAENRPMLALAEVAGFRAVARDGSMVSLRLCLP
jgi:acetyltransferase